MFPFQRNFKFGEVRSADEKHFPADTNIIGVAEYLVTFFAKLRTVLLVRVIVDLQLCMSCAPGVNFHFVSESAWRPYRFSHTLYHYIHTAVKTGPNP